MPEGCGWVEGRMGCGRVDHRTFQEEVYGWAAGSAGGAKATAAQGDL